MLNRLSSKAAPVFFLMLLLSTLIWITACGEATPSTKNQADDATTEVRESSPTSTARVVNLDEPIELPLVTAGETDVNIRSGPHTDYNIVGTLPSGESLEIIGRNSDSSWWLVSTPNGVGWIAAFITTASNVNDSILIVEALPLSDQNERDQPVDSTDTGVVTVATTESSAATTIPEPFQDENACHPNARITSPAPGDMFTSRVVAIRGYANVSGFNYYKIEYSTDPDSGTWNYLLQEDSLVENDVLMLLETSTVPYGPYGVRLTVIDMSGNYPEPCIRWFNDPRFAPAKPDPVDTKTPEQTNGDGTSEEVPCLCDGNSYNCSDFGSHQSAQACFNYCQKIGRDDVHDLDRDGDGSVCESR